MTRKSKRELENDLDTLEDTHSPHVASWDEVAAARGDARARIAVPEHDSIDDARLETLATRHRDVVRTAAQVGDFR